MLALIDALIVPRPSNPELVLRGRVLVVTSVCAIVAMISFLIAEYLLHIEDFTAEHIGFLSLSLFCLCLLRFYGAINIASHLLLAGIFVYFSWSSYHTGGLNSYLVPGLLVHPLASAMLAGLRFAPLWGAAGLASLFWMALADPENTVAMTPEAAYILKSMGLLLGAGAIGMLALIYEVSKVIGFQKLRQQKEEAESLIDRISQLLVSISQSISNIRKDVRAIAGRSGNIAGDLQEQSAFANDVNQSMNDLRGRIASNASDSLAVAADAASARERALSSASVLVSTGTNMQKVSEMVTQAQARIEELTRRSDEISSVVGVIQAVAQQTNLLALNAAIEAARAGEQGRGFAVVADEVRQLAERTSRSTGEIREQMSSILDVTQQAMTAMTQVSAMVNNGREDAARADAAVGALVHSYDDISRFLNTLADSSQEQNQLNEGITGRFEAILNAMEGAVDATAGIARTIQSLESEISTLSELSGSFGAERNQLFD